MGNAAVRIIKGLSLTSEEIRKKHNDLREECEQKNLQYQQDNIRIYRLGNLIYT